MEKIDFKFRIKINHFLSLFYKFFDKSFMLEMKYKFIKPIKKIENNQHLNFPNIITMNFFSSNGIIFFLLINKYSPEF